MMTMKPYWSRAVCEPSIRSHPTNDIWYETAAVNCKPDRIPYFLITDISALVELIGFLRQFGLKNRIMVMRDIMLSMIAYTVVTVGKKLDFLHEVK